MKWLMTIYEQNDNVNNAQHIQVPPIFIISLNIRCFFSVFLSFACSISIFVLLLFIRWIAIPKNGFMNMKP